MCLGQHLTGYCCWFIWGLGQHMRITGYCCWLCCASGNTLYCTLLGIAVGLCGASGNTLYWVLLLVMLRLGQHTLLAIVVGLWGASDNTLYWVLLWVMRGFGHHTVVGIIRSDVGRLHQWVQNNSFLNKSRKVGFRISSEIAEANIPHKHNHIALFPCLLILTSTNVSQSDKSHIHKLAPSPKPSGGREYAIVNCINFITTLGRLCPLHSAAQLIAQVAIVILINKPYSHDFWLLHRADRFLFADYTCITSQRITKVIIYAFR
jgi:hypothetical protein